MNATERVGKLEFRAALTAQDVRVMRVLHAALAVGITIFSLVVMIIASQQAGRPADPTTLATTRMLSLVHIALALFAWGLSPWLFGFLLRTRVPATGIHDAEPAKQLVSTLRGAGIGRLALLEAPAMLGLVVCLIGLGGGVLQEQPLYWLNALSALLFVLYVLATFPSQGRIEAIFEQHFTR